MSNYVPINNFGTTLAAPLTSSGTTATLASSVGLPTLSVGQEMPLTFNDQATGEIYEIVYVTAISGSTLTIIRAQEGTAAQAWSIGDYAKCNPTAGIVKDIQTQANLGVTNAAAAQTTANTAISNAATAQSTANTALAKAGFAQTITNVTASRSFGVPYSNPSSTKSMFVSVTNQTSTTGPTAIKATVDGITFQSTEAIGAANISMQLGFPVPPNGTYQMDFVTNVSTVISWIEWN